MKRIILLGDSFFFGWQLQDHEILAYQLQAELGDRYEVLTVALPSWNVLSEASFVDAHFHILDPDCIIWEICRNDVVDAPMAVPPGITASFASTQTPVLPTFTSSHFTLCPTPYFLERWDHNVRLVNDLKTRYQVPVAVLFVFVDISPPFLSILSQRVKFDFPAVLVASELQQDRRWNCRPGQGEDRGQYDRHPSAWANSTMCAAIIRKLTEMQIGKEVQLDASHSIYAEMHRPFEEVAPLERITYVHSFRDNLSKQRGRLAHHPGITTLHLGAGTKYAMADRGVFICTGSASATLTIDVDSRLLRFPRVLTLSVRSIEGTTVDSEHSIDGPEMVLKLELPPSEYGIYEIHWEFDFVACHSPTLRWCATLLSVDTR